VDRTERLEELFETSVSTRVTIPEIKVKAGEIHLDPDTVRKIVHAALELDHALVETAPDHVARDEHAERVAKALNDILKGILELAPGVETTPTGRRESLDVSESVIVVIRGDERKAVRDVLPEATVVQIGGPLIPEDYREVNPNIPDPVPEGIVKRAERARRELKEALEKRGATTLIFLREPEDEVADVVEKELRNMKEELGVEIKVLEVDFENLTEFVGEG